MGEAAASGQELGDLFEYKLKDRVTLKKNQSALVPIAQTEIEAERVSLWSGTTGSGRPLRGLWLKNTSPLTFDGGSFSVLENEVFAGEGLTDPINQRTSAHFVCDGPRAPGRSVKEQPTAARHASEDFERRTDASERVA